MVVWSRFIEPDLPTYLGYVFKEICRRYVEFRISELVPNEHAVRVGRQWEADFDFDVLAELTDGSLLVGECKAWSGPVGANVLSVLRGRAQRWASHGRLVRLALFSTHGFTPEVEDAALRGEVLLMTLDEMFEADGSAVP